MSENLKPCPYCGSKDVAAWGSKREGWTAGCQEIDCGAGFIAPTAEHVIQKWNLRTPDTTSSS